MPSMLSGHRPENFRLTLCWISVALLVASCAPLPLAAPPGTTEAKPSDATATPGLGAAFTDLPPDKQTAEVAVALTNQAVISKTTPEKPIGIPPTYTAEPFQTGIFPDPYGPLLPTFAVSSRWQGIIQGEEVYVYAGARKDPSLATPLTSTGMIYIIVRSLKFSARNEKEYVTPGETGVLTIVEEKDFRLTLMSEKGSKLFFDIPSRQIVDTVDAKVSAATATPLTADSAVSTPPQGYPALDQATPEPNSTAVP